MMKIALIHDWLVSLGGAESCLQVFHEIWPQAPLYTLVYEAKSAEKMGFDPNQIIASRIQRIRKADQRYRSFLPFFPLAVEQLDVSDYDVILSGSHCAAKGVLTRADQLHICYCHTPVRYAWDLTNRYLAEHNLTSGVKSVLARAALHYLRIWDIQTANRVDHFIANSNYTAERIWRTYRRPAVVIHPPVDTARFQVQSRKEEYFLFLSRIVPYKKADMVVQAFNRLGLPLKVVGDGPQLNWCRSLGGKNIEFLGYQDNNAVNTLLANARALIFAADEDFGIVPVEAQACGTPVIAFGKGGVRETVIPADGHHWDRATGILFPEQTMEHLVQAVEQFVRWEGRFQPEILRQNAERFSRDRFRREIDGFVQDKWQAFQNRGRIASGE